MKKRTRQAIDQEKTYTNHISGKELLSKTNSYNLTIRHATIQLKNGEMLWVHISIKNKHIKKSSGALITNEMQTKITLRSC